MVSRFGFERRPGYEEHQLRQQGIHRNVAVSCSSVALLGSLLVGTQRVATLPAKLAQILAASLPLRIVAAPTQLQLQPQRIEMYWHRAREQDPASRWFRGQLLALSASLGLLSPG